MKLFQGSCTALITPFDENGAIDFAEFGKMIEFQIENGTDAIVVAGSTGEPSTLTAQEKHDLIAYAVKKVNHRIVVIAGTGGNCTRTAIEDSKDAEALGVDGLLVVTPYYNKCTQNGLVAYYRAICESVKIPVLAYNVPARTGVNLLPKTAGIIAKIPNLVGLKDATGNMAQAIDTLRELDGNAELYCGDDDINFPMLAIGAAGIISVISNVIPKELKAMCDAFFAGDIATAQAWNKKMFPLSIAMFIEVNPIPAKAACNLIGFKAGTPRAPLTELEPQNLAKLEAAMAEFGVQHL